MRYTIWKCCFNRKQNSTNSVKHPRTQYPRFRGKAMKTQLVSRLSKKYILPHLPFYKRKGHLIYHKDITYFLQGFYFESSAFDKNLFTIEVFVQPLFIPITYITLTYGNRLRFLSKGRDIWWEYDEAKEEELMDEILSMITSFGVPFLEDRNHLDRFILKYGKFGFGDNPHLVEGICYTHVLIGDYLKAKIMLSSFNKVLKKEIEKSPKTEWMVEMKDRTHLIFDFLENQNFVKAKEQLEEWRNFTVEKLGISGG